MNAVEVPRKFSSLKSDIFYDRDEESEEHSDSDVFTLTELCASKLVSSHSLLPKRQALPQQIQDILWDCAVKHNRPLAICRLLSTWKRSTIYLRPPSTLNTWRLFYWANLDILKLITKLQCIVVAIIDHTINTLQRDVDFCETIQFVDLSEIPITDIVILRICQNIKALCRSMPASRLSCLNQNRSTRHKCRKCSCFDCNKILIRLNCIINQSQIMSSLCEAWIAGKNGSSPVELEISSFRIMPEAFCERTLVSLNVLDPAMIKVFNCSFCRIPSLPQIDLYNRLKTFQNLKTLDLTYIALDSVRNPDLIGILAEALQTFVHLEQLHLSFSRITGCLQLLLSKIHADRPSKLKHLGVYCCFLGVPDFFYLSQSHHAKALNNLEISGNRLTLECLRNLMGACENLRVLEMESCIFSDDQESISQIFDTFSSLKNLRYLNMAHFQGICFKEVLSEANKIACLSNLKCLKVSHPNCRSCCFLFPKHSPDIQKEYTKELKAALQECGSEASEFVKVIV